GLGQRGELRQRLSLDLADALTGHAEDEPDFVERARGFAGGAVARRGPPALPVVERVEAVRQSRGAGNALRGILGEGQMLFGQEGSELEVCVVTERAAQRH